MIAPVRKVPYTGLLPELEASVLRLREMATQAVATEIPPRTFTDDDPEALAAALDTVKELRRSADDLEAAGDARHWFSRLYQYVTEELIETCRRGDVAHPTWVLRLVPRFHTAYARNLETSPERHWAEAFDAIAEAANDRDAGALAFWRAVVAGARAHIEGDLPRVLRATYEEHYAGRCDYVRFRADCLLLSAPLGAAWKRLSSDVPARWFPPHLRVLDKMLPDEAIEHLTAQRFYDPLLARRRAFEAGRRPETAITTGWH